MGDIANSSSRVMTLTSRSWQLPGCSGLGFSDVPSGGLSSNKGIGLAAFNVAARQTPVLGGEWE